MSLLLFIGPDQGHDLKLKAYNLIKRSCWQTELKWTLDPELQVRNVSEGFPRWSIAALIQTQMKLAEWTFLLDPGDSMLASKIEVHSNCAKR